MSQLLNLPCAAICRPLVAVREIAHQKRSERKKEKKNDRRPANPARSGSGPDASDTEHLIISERKGMLQKKQQ